MALFLSAIFVLQAGVSQLSRYRIRQAGYVVNLAIAEMLTPWGLVRNLWLHDHPELYRFYFRENGRAGIFASPALALLVCATVALAGFWLWRERKERP